MLRLQRELKITVVFITHSIREAMKLGDRILVMDQGMVLQLDTPEQIKTHPVNEFVQELIQEA